MKKVLFIILFLSFYNWSYSQDFAEAKVIYKLEYNRDIENRMSSSINKLLKKSESIRKNKLRFELLFNKEKACYKHVDVLIPEGEEVYYVLASRGNFSQVYYRDKKNKSKYTKSNEENFNVVYPYNEYQWKITKETKTILGYTCYKAVATVHEFNSYGEVKEYTPKAWFTYDLPYSYGPKGYDGLPGLVLEQTSNDKIFIKAIKIERGIKEPFPKLPKDAKQISSIEYNKQQAELAKERRKKY